MSNSISLDEQETTINLYNPYVSKRAEIYTCINTMIRRLRKIALQYPEEVTIRDDDYGGMFCTVPASWIRVTPKRKCNQTEEQRKENGRKLAAYREANRK